MPFVRLLYEKVVFYVLLCVRVCACVCAQIDTTQANCCITNIQQIDITASPYNKVRIQKVS